MKIDSRCWRTPEPICPYCRTPVEDAIYELGLENLDECLVRCESCGKDFMVRAHIEYSFSSGIPE